MEAATDSAEVVADTSHVTGRQILALAIPALGQEVPAAPIHVQGLVDGRQFMQQSHWVATIPGVAILLMVVGFNLLGDGLRDVLDPQLKEF